MKQLDQFMTVGDLKKRLENVPDDVPVLYERLHDDLFENETGWAENSWWVKWDGINQYVQAWDAGYQEEKRCFLITAHY